MENTTTNPSTLMRVSISQLVHSSLNVRKKPSTGISELAALIASQGLIQNLVVVAQLKKNKPTGKFEVTSGSRRFDALQLLVADGRYRKEQEIDCRLVDEAEAKAMSLAENSGREAMHPSDLVVAYRDLSSAGKSSDEIASLFGVTPLTVKRYLKLANVSPVILALYADNQINFEQISALALTDDHELQARVWSTAPAYSRSGNNLRRMITETEVDISNSVLAKFVGVKAYEKAGGTIRRDLFSDEDNGYMQDAGLLERLALTKLEKAAEKIKEEGFAWVQCHPEYLGYSDFSNYGRVRTIARDGTEAEQTKIAALEAELQALINAQEALGDDEGKEGRVVLEEKQDALEVHANAIQEKLDALLESFESPDPEQLAVAGAMVFIGHDGKVKVERGLIRREDMRKAASSGSNGVGEGMEEGEAIKQKPIHSERLTRMLTAHRTAVIQASIANRADVALAAVVSQLAGRLFADYRSRSGVVVQINMEQPRLKNDAEDIDRSRAVAVIEEKYTVWASRIEAVSSSDTRLFDWLLQQPQEEVLDLLALWVSASINSVASREDSPAPEVCSLMNALNLDMADWWAPTAETYLSHVGKDRIIGMVADAVSPQIAQTLTKLKKGELVKAAEEHLFGLRWLPDNLKKATT